MTDWRYLGYGPRAWPGEEWLVVYRDDNAELEPRTRDRIHRNRDTLNRMLAAIERTDGCELVGIHHRVIPQWEPLGECDVCGELFTADTWDDRHEGDVHADCCEAADCTWPHNTLRYGT